MIRKGMGTYQTRHIEGATLARDARDDACLSLWGAVLLLSATDAEGPADALNTVRARTWLADESDEAGSFVWICEACGLPPDSVRKNIFAKVLTGV